MSRLLCECGYVIYDHSLRLDYKARLISDQEVDDFFSWITNEIQEYVVAAQEGRTGQWMLDKGFGKRYIDLGLDHGNVLHDYIYAKFLDKQKDVYECMQCGRLHIERENNSFLSFFPKNSLFNALFKSIPSNPPIKEA